MPTSVEASEPVRSQALRHLRRQALGPVGRASRQAGGSRGGAGSQAGQAVRRRQLLTGGRTGVLCAASRAPTARAPSGSRR